MFSKDLNLINTTEEKSKSCPEILFSQLNLTNFNTVNGKKYIVKLKHLIDNI